MKKSIALIISIALLFSIFIFPNSISAVTIPQTGENGFDYTWSFTKEVSDTGRYFRAKRLNNGDVVGVYYKSGDGIYFVRSTDGGISFGNPVLIQENTTHEEYGRLETQNPNIIELEDGRLMAFYRYNTYTSKNSDGIYKYNFNTYYSSISYRISSDGGLTWGDSNLVAKETSRTIEEIASATSDYGYWEPDPYYVGNDLLLYYADTSTPNNLSYQHIMVCKWDSETETFGESSVAQDGTAHGSRDGMSVVTKLSDGNYAMVIESTAVGAELAGNATFVIKMSFSQDGINWTEPVTVAQPENLGQKATSGENAVCASPYVVTLPDGRLAISYQTTDRYTGLTPARVSYAVGSQVAISNEAIVYSEDTAPTVSTASFTKLTEGPGELAENAFSKSAGLLCSDGYLLAYYNNGSNTAESKFTFSNVEVAAMKLPEAESSDQSLDGYELYNNSSSNKTINDVKLNNGERTFPQSISTLLRTEPYSANQPAYKTEITGLYNEASYTQVNKNGKALAFDADDKTVTNQAGEQSRNWIKGTEYMQGFSAKATIKGASNGAIQAGFGFHMQQKDFTPETFAFSTSGYTVMIVRSADSLSKFTVRVRYISGTSVKNYVNSDFNFLSGDINEKITLSVWADNRNFYVVAATEDGSKTTGTLTYPLNNGTVYYPSGGFMLTANGTAVFSNFELSKSTYLKRAQNLEASADIKLAATNQNQAGFVLRVQDTDTSEKGSTSYTVSGYAVRVVNEYKANTTDKLKLVLSRLGTNSDGIECTKLGDMYSVDVTKAICDTAAPSTQTVNMKATVIGSTLTVVLTNKADASLTKTYTFDLTRSAGGYNNYYSYGGFGLFKNTSQGSISNVSFKVLSSEENINKLNPESYTVYQQGTGGRFDTDRFVADDASGKKIILNSATVTDFTADAVFKISADGQLKAGIVFRAQSLGNSQDDMEGYSCCVYKTDNKTGNYGRIVLLVYKWARQADGTLSYFGTVGSKPNLTALNSVYPLAESNILGAAGAHIRLKLTVEGTKAKAEFEVLDDNNAVAASSGETVFDLTKKPTGVSGSKTFNDDAYNTVFNAGAIGLSISSKGEICDFNITDAADNIEDALVVQGECENGFVYAALNSGAANIGDTVKLVAVPANEGEIVAEAYYCIGDKKYDIPYSREGYIFSKQFGKTVIYASFGRFAPGDLDKNGTVNAADMVCLRQDLLDIKPYDPAVANCNGDENVDIRDLVSLKKALANAS